MIKKIVVPTDFSDCSLKAVDFAVQSAKLLSADIILIHAFDLEDDLYTDYMGVNKEFNQSQLNDVQIKLAKLKDNIYKKEGIEVSTTIYKCSLNKAIQEITEDKSVGIIVMGTAGASGIKKIFFGSNTAAVMTRSKIPVLVIPYSYKWQKPENILFVTNHFERENSVLDLLFEMADFFTAQVHVVVFTDEENAKSLNFIEDSRNLSHYENMIRDKYNQQNLAAVHLTGKNFQTALESYIVDQNIDVLAMVNYDKGFWERIFQTSMARSMSYHTKIPLLTIPGKK